jgi:hypothetical protein
MDEGITGIAFVEAILKSNKSSEKWIKVIL